MSMEFDSIDTSPAICRSHRHVLATCRKNPKGSTERLPKLYTRELAELIFVQPYCRIANVVDAGIAKRQTASDYLKQLTDIGLLEERAVGREKLFINPAFLRLLSDRSA